MKAGEPGPEPQPGDPGYRPALASSTSVRGLRHDQDPARTQEAGSTLGGDGWGAEASRHHHGQRLPPRLLAGEVFGPGLQDPHAAGQAEGAEGGAEEVGSPTAGIEEECLCRLPEEREHQTGNTATAPQVEDGLGRRGGERRPHRLGEPAGVLDVWLNGARAQVAEAARLGEDRGEGDQAGLAESVSRRTGGRSRPAGGAPRPPSGCSPPGSCSRCRALPCGRRGTWAPAPPHHRSSGPPRRPCG